MCWLCVVGGSNEGARPGVSVFREAVGSLGWTESGSRAWRRANPKSRTVKKVPTFPESTSSRLRKVRLSARADAGGPAVARTGRIVAEAGHGEKEKSAPPAAPNKAFLRFPERRRRAILKTYSRAAGSSYAEIPPGRRASGPESEFSNTEAASPRGFNHGTRGRRSSARRRGDAVVF